MDVLNSATIIRGSGHSATRREIDKCSLNKKSTLKMHKDKNIK